MIIFRLTLASILPLFRKLPFTRHLLTLYGLLTIESRLRNRSFTIFGSHKSTFIIFIGIRSMKSFAINDTLKPLSFCIFASSSHFIFKRSHILYLTLHFRTIFFIFSHWFFHKVQLKIEFVFQLSKNLMSLWLAGLLQQIV